jgi:hypothetical protein
VLTFGHFGRHGARFELKDQPQGNHCMPPRFVALNSKISVATTSVTPPQKSAQAKKIFSVTVTESPPGHVGLRLSRA